MKLITAITFILICIPSARGQEYTVSVPNDNSYNENKTYIKNEVPGKGRINFFVFTKEKTKKRDWPGVYVLTRARIKSFFHHKSFRVIRAHTTENAAMKIEAILKKHDKLIKNIWFDSHGHYGNRYSSFRVGKDQFSYKNINDSISVIYLEKIAAFCDEQTKVALGSCYAAADFYFPATDSTPATRMNGDSLMIGLGKIFNRSTIYACESWVMSKPGIFSNKFGFAGYPLNKSFKDAVYAPVWERLGMWRRYSFQYNELKRIPTIALDRYGNIHVRAREYHNLPKAKKKIGNALKNLKHGLASFS